MESAFEAVGIVANIMQLISFAHQAIGFCKEVYAGGSPDAFLVDNAKSLGELSSQLETHLVALALQGRKTEDDELAELAKKCTIAARALQEELKFLDRRHSNGRLVETIRIFATTHWRKTRLRRLQTRLTGYQVTMETRLIARNCTQTAALELQQREEFSNLNGSLQRFVCQVAHGHTKLGDLVQEGSKVVMDHTSTLAQKTMDHTSHEVLRTGTALMEYLGRQMADLGNSMASDSALQMLLECEKRDERRRVLGSLKFLGMNDRRNQVFDAANNTCQWIFEPESSENTQLPLWDNFSEWLRSDSGIYWVSGKAGAGKSTLMKVIIGDGRTKSLLQEWKPGAVVLSHFFWKAGIPLDRNIKGFCCSLLYQIFSNDEQRLHHLLERFPHFSLKDQNQDWAVLELQAALLSVLGNPEVAFCICVDGLDEVCEDDGADSLLDTLAELWTRDNVKICASSRPEWRFQRRLSNQQHLQLQDLTKQDMQQYVRDALEPDLLAHFGDGSGVSRLIHRLIENADGVFLWLCLAVKSLRRGIDGGDTLEKLFMRLVGLPIQLSKLYSDMWSRLNQDDREYHREGARFLNLILLFKRVDTQCKLAAITASVNEALWRNWVDSPRQVEGPYLDSACKRMRDQLNIRCAGLLEVKPTQPQDQPSSRWVVDFIHASAYEFLTGTDEGREILERDSRCQADELHLQAAEGYVVAGLQHDSLDRRTVFHILSHCWSPASEQRIARILDAVCRTSRTDLPSFLEEATDYPRLDFYVLSFFNPECERSRRVAHPRALATQLLSAAIPQRLWLTEKPEATRGIYDMFDRRMSITSESPIEFFRALLSHGADLDSPETYCVSAQVAAKDNCVGRMLTSQAFLRLLGPRIPSQHIPECLEAYRDTVSAVLETHPRLDVRRAIIFSVPGAANPSERQHELCKLGPFEPTFSMRDSEDMSYVAVVNLAFLVSEICGTTSIRSSDVGPTLEIPFAIRHLKGHSLTYTLRGTQVAGDAVAMFRGFLAATRSPARNSPTEFLRQSVLVREACVALEGVALSYKRLRENLIESDCGYYYYSDPSEEFEKNWVTDVTPN